MHRRDWVPRRRLSGLAEEPFPEIVANLLPFQERAFASSQAMSESAQAMDLVIVSARMIRDGVRLASVRKQAGRLPKGLRASALSVGRALPISLWQSQCLLSSSGSLNSSCDDEGRTRLLHPHGLLHTLEGPYQSICPWILHLPPRDKGEMPLVAYRSETKATSKEYRRPLCYRND